MLAAALVAVAVVALLFVAAQKWFLTEREEPEAATPNPAVSAPKPLPMPPPAPASNRTGPQGVAASGQPETPGTKPVEGGAAAAAQAPPAPERETVSPVIPQPRPEPARLRTMPVQEPPITEQALQLVTDPPGASAVLDNEPSKTCTTPCSFQVASGRHTLAFSLEGYHRELRIVDVSGPKELFVGMTRPIGTIWVESEPAGAQILVNNQPRAETTPATLVLPAGKYVLAVVKNGRRAERAVELKDGSLMRLNLQLNP